MDAEPVTLPIHSIRRMVPGAHAQALNIYMPVAEAIHAIRTDIKMAVFGDHVGFALNIRDPKRDSFSIRAWAPPWDVAGEDLWIVHYGDLTCDDGKYEYFDTATPAATIAEAVANLFAEPAPSTAHPEHR